MLHNNRFASSKGKVLLCFLTILLLSGCGQKHESIIIGRVHQLRSAIMDESRYLYIYKPEGYELSGKRYPVLYLLDGDAHFNHVAGIIEFLAQRVQIPKMIVVGIQVENPEIDFSNFQEIKESGASPNNQFLRFIESEVIPYIEENYNTQPYRILAGHSLGGLCVLNTMLTKPGIFNAYLSISPWLKHNNNQILRDIKDQIPSRTYTNDFLFISYAGTEYYALDQFEELEEILSKGALGTLRWTVNVQDQECHETTSNPGIWQGIKLLYADWRVPHFMMRSGIETINTHFKNISKQFGYDILIPELVLNIVGYQILETGDFEEAITIFEQTVDTYPNSANAYDSLGDAYEQAGNLELALDSYNMAYEKAIRMDDPNLKMYKNHISRIRKKLRDSS